MTASLVPPISTPRKTWEGADMGTDLRVAGQVVGKTARGKVYTEGGMNAALGKATRACCVDLP